MRVVGVGYVGASEWEGEQCGGVTHGKAAAATIVQGAALRNQAQPVGGGGWLFVGSPHAKTKAFSQSFLMLKMLMEMC